MNRDLFLNQLRHNLYGLSEEEINDIIQDYEEHFQIGLSKGKSEEEISMELGNPRDIAKNYINSTATNHKDETIYPNTNKNGRKFILLALLILFNLIIVLGPYLGIVGILLGIFGLGIGLFFAGIGILFGAPFVAIKSVGQLNILTTISFCIAFTALGISIVLLGTYLAKLLYKFTVRYIKCNIDVING